MTTLDSSWLKFWEFVSEFGFIMVIIGVIGEGTELKIQRRFFSFVTSRYFSLFHRTIASETPALRVVL
jgi:hypothetical protein